MTGPTEARFDYEPSPDIDEPLVAGLGRYPREPELLRDVARAVGRRVAAGLVKGLVRLRVSGAPPDLPRLVLVANHESHLDTLAILAALPDRLRRRVAVLAARDYFFTRPPAAIAAAIFGQGVAFERQDIAELRRWARLLRDQDQGWFIVYPSGSRRTTELHAGLIGVLHQAGWPILPVRLRGTGAAWPVGRWPRPFRPVEVRFGVPLDVTDADDLVPALVAAWKEDPR